VYRSNGKTAQESMAQMYIEKDKYNEQVLFALKSVLII
jgi:hypothetical protein